MELDDLMGSGKSMPSVTIPENANVSQEIVDKLISQETGFNELLAKIEDKLEGQMSFIENYFDGSISARWGFEYEYLTLFFDIDAPGVSEQKMDENVDAIDAYVSGVANKLFESLDEISGFDDVKSALRDDWQLCLGVTLNGEEYEL